jgi:peptidyl-prolyl cis-trans isomerase B (cyclophilin B)
MKTRTIRTKITAALLAALLLSALASGCGKTENEPPPGGAATDSEPSVPVVDIVFRDFGAVTVELDRDAAPITVDNFIKLASDGFYDGLTIHRVSAGFVIQGGDPSGNGTGGSEANIKGEFASNSWEKNTISHKRGVISMARSSDPDSASSQFFIVLQDAEFLDGDYAAFGAVTAGMDVVDKIGAVETLPYTETPAEPVVIESVKVR